MYYSRSYVPLGLIVKIENCKQNSGNNLVKRVVVIKLFFLLLLCFFSSVSEAGLDKISPGSQTIPAEYGEIIYRCNESSPDQIYIIGMGHRDTFTRKNSFNSINSQVEVFRLAEWMIRNEGLELLLPEGFFLRSGEEDISDKRGGGTGEYVSPDRVTLRKKLENDSVYTNAEMMLMENYGIKSQQVEDDYLYNAVKAAIRLLADDTIDEYEALYIMSRIDYLQQRRTAAMLQKIPDIVTAEFLKGRIKNRKAIFTMGLGHISEIIKFLAEKHIAIHAPPFLDIFDDYFAEVKLLKENFGVTVIIPKSLSESQEIVKLTRLDNLI